MLACLLACCCYCCVQPCRAWGASVAGRLLDACLRLDDDDDDDDDEQPCPPVPQSTMPRSAVCGLRSFFGFYGDAALWPRELCDGWGAHCRGVTGRFCARAAKAQHTRHCPAASEADESATPPSRSASGPVLLRCEACRVRRRTWISSRSWKTMMVTLPSATHAFPDKRRCQPERTLPPKQGLERRI